jgi:hypothetical protein
MSNPITLGDAYWEHQQLQKQINEVEKGVLGVEIDIIAFKRSVLISDIVSSNMTKHNTKQMR